MRVHILGSGAGGGVPQWNCGCRNCRTARRHCWFSVPRSLSSNFRRTQSSVVVTDDEKRWVLLNASPDLSTQFASFPILGPTAGKLRGSAIEAVVLTDGELDHVTGLLSLREQKKLRLVCTRTVLELLSGPFRMLPALRRYCKIRHSSFPVCIGSLHISAIDVFGKVPPYATRAIKKGDVVGLRIESIRTGKKLGYLPGLPAIIDSVCRFVTNCDCLLVDGTFWSNDEMTSLGFSKRSARDMGHVPVNGNDGSLRWLCELDISRKIYVHINNTNPILRCDSREQRTVEQAGIEIAYDGMDIQI